MESNCNSTYFGPNLMATALDGSQNLKRKHKREYDNPVISFLNEMQPNQSIQQDAAQRSPEGSRKRAKLSESGVLSQRPLEAAGNQYYLPSPAHSPHHQNMSVEHVFQSQGQQQRPFSQHHYPAVSAPGSMTGIPMQSSYNLQSATVSNAGKISLQPASSSVYYMPQNGQQNPSLVNAQQRASQFFSSIPHSLLSPQNSAPRTQLQDISDSQFIQLQLQRRPQYLNPNRIVPHTSLSMHPPQSASIQGAMPMPVQGKAPGLVSAKRPSRSIDRHADIIMALINEEVRRAWEVTKPKTAGTHRDAAVSTSEDDGKEKNSENGTSPPETSPKVLAKGHLDISEDQKSVQEHLQGENERLKADSKALEDRQQRMAVEIMNRLRIVQSRFREERAMWEERRQILEAENAQLKAQTQKEVQGETDDKTRTDVQSRLFLELGKREESQRLLEEENIRMKKELELADKKIREKTEEILKLQDAATAEREKWEAERKALENDCTTLKDRIKNDAKENESKSLIIQSLNADRDKWEQDWRSLKRKNAQKKADLGAAHNALEESASNIARLQEELDMERAKVKITWKRSEVKKDHWLKIVRDLESKVDERKNGAAKTPEIDSNRDENIGEAFQENYSKLQQIRDQLSKELESWKADYSSLEAENAQSKDIVNRLENTIIKLESKLCTAKVT